MVLTGNNPGVLVLLNVSMLGPVSQGVRVVLLHRVVELHLWTHCQQSGGNKKIQDVRR